MIKQETFQFLSQINLYLCLSPTIYFSQLIN